MLIIYLFIFIVSFCFFFCQLCYVLLIGLSVIRHLLRLFYYYTIIGFIDIIFPSSCITSAIDIGVGEVVQSLKDANMYDNTVIIFTSDNGGDVGSGGSNYPLRGNKGALYEGGKASQSLLKVILETWNWKEYINYSNLPTT